MKPLEYFDVQAQQVAKHPVQVLKLEWKSNDAAAAGMFVHVFDSAIAPATGDVPTKCWMLLSGGAQDYKEFKNGELRLTKGLSIAVSSSESTYTAATGSDKLSALLAELADAEDPSSTSFAGDLTSAVTGLTVWTDAQGPRKLIALEVDGTNLPAGTSYIQLFGTTTGLADGAVPIDVFPIDAAAVRTGVNALRFGKDGRDVLRLTAGTVYQDGCIVRISSTPATLTLIASGSARIKAEYK